LVRGVVVVDQQVAAGKGAEHRFDQGLDVIGFIVCRSEYEDSVHVRFLPFSDSQSRSWLTRRIDENRGPYHWPGSPRGCSPGISISRILAWSIVPREMSVRKVVDAAGDRLRAAIAAVPNLFGETWPRILAPGVVFVALFPFAVPLVQM